MFNKEGRGYPARTIKTRIAPAPTGPLHLGTARTALFNWLFARQNKGKFVLRIEDTDIERSDPIWEKDIGSSLKWLGLDWDEGPYRQSTRTKIYKNYLARLLEQERGYWKEGAIYFKIKDQRSKIKKTNQKPKIKFKDIIRGEISFDISDWPDMVIAKDLEHPLYNFCCVVDDYEMKISHVIRGEDHISNTPKQILIQEALGFPQPQYAHLPLILGPDRSKLSKRHGAVAVSEYRQLGYLAEAMNNYLALLGWNPGTEKELFSLKELIKEFSLGRVQKGGAVFNLERLNWFNGIYIRKLNLDDLARLCLPYLPKAKFSYIKKVVALEQERLDKLSEIGERTKFFFEDKLEYKKELLTWKKMSFKEIKDNLFETYKILQKLTKFDQKSLKDALSPLTEKRGKGKVLWPLRVALSGLAASPNPFEIAEVLEKEKTLQRIKEAINKL